MSDVDVDVCESCHESFTDDDAGCTTFACSGCGAITCENCGSSGRCFDCDLDAMAPDAESADE